MTDVQTGSVAEKSAGNPAAQSPEAGNGSAAEGAKSWIDGLSEGNRQLAKAKGWTTPESLDKAFSSYAELEKLQGESLRPPKPDAPPEEWNKFYSKVGRPESPDKYEFKRPDNLPSDLPYQDDLAKASKAWMYEAGLNPRQAQVVHDKWFSYAAQQQQAQREALKTALESTHDELVKDWGGPPDSEAFKTKLAMANKALDKLGWTDRFKKKGLLLEDGGLTDSQLARGLAVIGEMFREDTIDGGGLPGTADNPFKRDANGKIRSVTAISALIKSDPERAKRLASEAGEDQRNWFSQNPY
jgi:hypothetical protein